MALSPINFQKSSGHSYKHNFRYDKPNYLLKENDWLGNDYWENELSAKEIFENELSKAHRRGGRIPKFENSHWEAVLNLNKEHTLDDVKKVADYLENKLNITCATIVVHRDEGHYKNDKVYHNFHAHLTFVTYKNNQQNWRQEKVRNKLREIQTEVAKILKMKRGQENSEKTRLSAKQFKKIAQELEAKDQTIQDIINATKEATNTADEYIQELEAELEQEKLNSKEIKAYIEQFRKNCAGKGLPKEFFRDISNLKQQAEPTTKELLDNTLKTLLQSYLREKERNIELENENEALKAENNEIKAQKHTLTQEQIQEIINQALAQKEAEIEKIKKEARERETQKNQEIQDLKTENTKLKNEKERFHELLEQDPALNKAYNQALEALKNREKTPNNEELTENLGKQATYFLNNFFKDDVSTLQTPNTDKIEHSEQDQENNDDLGIDKIIIHKNQEQTQEHNKPKIHKHR